MCNFCRFPELASIAARRLLWVVNEHYVDDNDTCEPEFCKDSGQQALISLCSEQFFGFPFDETKHTEMEPSNEYLGVVTDLSRAHENVLQVSVTSKRRKKIRDIGRVTQNEYGGQIRSRHSYGPETTTQVKQVLKIRAMHINGRIET